MRRIAAVFRFEWQRALAPARLAWWAGLALFPAFIVTLIRLSLGERRGLDREEWAVFLFAIVPMLVTMLGAFLWSAPAVSEELERKSWPYIAVRPHGRVCMLLGKYLAAVTWVLPATLAGLTLAILIARTGDDLALWKALAMLACLSCPAYAAVYLALGVLFPKRSMVFAVGYTLIFELVIAFVPAFINKLSIQFRLRALLIDWAQINIPDAEEFSALQLVSDLPAWRHVLVLIAYTVVLLLFSTLLIRAREFSVAEESAI